ncbi:hypothetical protein D1AOALGA4SA_4111 [Olavius algarvensis Delta 1 endosymbiont]|nr:hypothetical protein D1AOALGA4SA_4111 [Olavius algarvensis Delta 1 endosymbiont]
MVATSGRIGGFEGHTSGSSIQRKINMLKAEGVEINGGKIKNLEQILFRF